jgi:hypothetical protein
VHDGGRCRSQVLGPEGASRPREVSLKRINHLLDKHITADDGTIFEAITGTSLQELRHALTNAPNVTVDRFLSADRWVHSELNTKGLHMLRCTLAERVVEERRREAGVTDHPDYEDMVRDGFLVKDFSSFNNTQLQDLLSMVSGYNVSGPAALSLAPLCWRSAGGSPLVVVISWLAGPARLQLAALLLFCSPAAFRLRVSLCIYTNHRARTCRVSIGPCGL